MSRLGSQALQRLWRIAHAAVAIALGMALVITASTGALVWRLSQSPIDLAWLTPRLEAILNTDSANRIHVDSVALAWEGWRGGVDRPVDLRLRGITTTDDHGAQTAKIPQVELSLSFGWLLLGRLVPRAIEIDNAHTELLRATDGTFSLGIGAPPPALVVEAARLHMPLLDVLGDLIRTHGQETRLGAARSRWSELRRIRIRNASIVLIDRNLETIWRFPRANLDIRRTRDGGMIGSADMSLLLDDRPVQLQMTVLLPKQHGAIVQARFELLDLEALARSLPRLKMVGVVHGLASGTMRLSFGSGLDWQEGMLQAELGQAVLRLGEGSVPILGATLSMSLSPGQAELGSLRVRLAGVDGAGPVVTIHGRAQQKSQRVVVGLEADLDKVEMADLASFWPAGLASGARSWMIRNVTAGSARTAHFAVALQAADDGSDPVLTGATGTVSADDLTIHWLRPLPPLEHVKADLTVLSPDSLLIRAEGGQLAGAGQRAILLRSGTMAVTGMMKKDQFGDIQVNLASSIPDTVSLLREPRLRLLDRHPFELNNPSGQATAQIALNLWLDNRVTIDSIPIHAAAQLHNVRIAGVLGTRDLSDGEMTLDVNNDGMQLAGTGAVAGIPAEIGMQMDFHSGPTTQIRTRYRISGFVHADQLSNFGVDPGDAVRGPVSIRAGVLERRDGTGEADIQADLRQAELVAAPLGWRKRRGQSATGIAHLILDHDRIIGIDRLVLEAEAMSVEAAVQFDGGKPTLVRLKRAVLGNTSATGEIQLATAPGLPVHAKFAGSSLDLAGRFNRVGAADENDRSKQLPWSADLKFDRVLLGPGRALSGLVAQIRDDGRIVQQARIAGHLDGAGQFTLLIIPEAGNSRRMTVESSNAGSLLRALGVMDTMDGGRLVLAARYEDAAGDPLAGTAEIDSFRLRDAPAATRVLEGMTLYGLVTALRGPGLEISRLVAPFRLSGSVLQLNDARAFSPSLGFTAKGRIDLQQRVAVIDGTIVPAYFFNSLLGRIPILGNLFSPEKGGGMFAATYKIRGQLDNPAVSVNPLAALTPGFLRGLFGAFETTGTQAQALGHESQPRPAVGAK